MLGGFDVIVVCSVWPWGRAMRGPVRFPFDALRAEFWVLRAM
jgi:hypothetical protein